MHCVTRFVIPFYQHFTRHQFAKRKDSRLIILLILHFISICCTKCIYRENRFRIEKLDSNFAPSPSRLKLSRGPGRKIRFAIRYPVTELDIARFIAFLTGIFQRKKGGGNDRIDMRKSLWGGNPWSVIRSRPRHKAKSC